MAASEVIEIAPHGDVLLLCGEQVGEGKIVGLRVNSHIMSYGSPVFKALLGPVFKEGTTLAASSTVGVPLPEDNPEHMARLCNIFHMRGDNVSQFDLISLEEFAQLCDKYDCTLATKPAVERYILAVLPTVEVGTMDYYLGIAVTLRCVDAVKRIAVLLIHQATRPITEIVAPKGLKLGTTCTKIDKTFHEARREISTFIESVIDAQHMNRGLNSRCDTKCTVGMRRVFSLLTQLKAYKLWSSTTERVSLESMLRCMENLRLHDPVDLSPCKLDEQYCAKGYGNTRLECYQPHFGEIASQIRQLIEAMEFPELGKAS
ncbi:hypothetical protein LTR91_008895 [Friedmanniomyces endolithicus]|uniref:BTB domain-containing protein n=1 Tax=Friedmanniomyces endolithicus TaxID=329885 RepID=A0AAN6QTQ5_9PEZI|nr:hypothetical protein LTR59_013604 [Friedmanniomyces endolithicus]KAK0784276.1 hypothetical protein LTR38_012738 [Friedmanniomyces endolithicus]KAK0853813.1 hypothetical protein LTS02_011829 [Friedmanniomyces endolithicus]KAK0884367.1 hypothetical protein LTR87_001998 [Friedmanniomyces endolithicus]KAK0902672.1 hypothetical protein LTR02_007974 [Friedmanniomyces endolithicus]